MPSASELGQQAPVGTLAPGLEDVAAVSEVNTSRQYTAAPSSVLHTAASSKVGLQRALFDQT